MKKRFISALLALLMLVTMVPVTAMGANSYTINDVIVRYTDSAITGNCWGYANEIYKKIWGKKFTNSFNDSDNSLRNLSDSELTLTESHLKAYVSNAALGSVIRITTGDYLHGTDDWGHSQIIVQKDDKGFTVFQASPDRNETYYTWSSYISNQLAEFVYIKYIKWPGAEAYSTHTQNLDDYVTEFEKNAVTINGFYCLASGKTSAPVRSSPHNEGAVIGTLGSGETIHISKKGKNGKNSSYWYYIDTGKFAGGYIYSDNVQETTVSLIEFTGLGMSHTYGTYSVGTNTATLTAVITSNVLSTIKCTGTGIELYDNSGSTGSTHLLKRYYNNYSAKPLINDKLYIAYEMKGEVGYTLSPNTKYYYRFYAEIDTGSSTAVYYSDLHSFTTIGTSPHTHSYNTLKSDGTNHWYECSCGAKSGTAAHTYGSWKTSTAATCTANGSRYRTCTVCGYEQTETIPAKGHSYSSAWQYNDTYHWHECSCGEKTDKTSHTFSSNNVCTTCGYNCIRSGKCGESVNWTLNTNTGVLTIEGTGAMYDYDTTDPGWQSFASKIETLVIKKGVTKIGNYAFYRCRKLEDVTIPDGVTSIGKGAFLGCAEDPFFSFFYSGLTNITMPNRVTSIGERAFEECSNLESIILPENITDIGAKTFYDCSSLERITIPNGVISIGQQAFYGCKNLTDVYYVGTEAQWKGITIGSSNSYLTSATIHYHTHDFGTTWKYDEDYHWQECACGIKSTKAEHTFVNGICSVCGCSCLVSGKCGSSVNWTLDKSLGTLTINGTGAMYDYDTEYPDWEDYASIIKSVVIEKGVTNIGKYAFYEYSNLQKITIPDSVTSIGESAFYHCTSLTSITIPSGVTSIEESTFEYCSKLTSITIPDSVTNIGIDAFFGCNNLADVYYNGTETQWKSIKTFFGNSALTSATIHYLHEHQFDTAWKFDDSNHWHECSCGEKSGAAEHTFVNGICSVCGCSCLVSGKCNTNVTWTLNKSTGLLTISGIGTAINSTFGSYSEKIKTIVIENGITEIGEYLFSDCSALMDVTIPDSVISIDDFAFAYCNKLTSIIIPSGVMYIGICAFGDCNNLTSITIPSSVENMDIFALAGCSKLTDIYYGGTESQWNNIDFEGTYTGNFSDLINHATIHYNSEPAVTDFDGDGVLDDDDLSILMRHIAKVELITDANMLKLADVNKDGKLSAADLTALTAYIVA